MSKVGKALKGAIRNIKNVGKSALKGDLKGVVQGGVQGIKGDLSGYAQKKVAATVDSPDAMPLPDDDEMNAAAARKFQRRFATRGRAGTALTAGTGGTSSLG